MSFLIEVSEPVFFFSELRSSLGRYVASHPDTEPPQGAVYIGTKAREAGYIFGLTALGMCIMRIPPQVVRIEAARLAPVISEVRWAGCVFSASLTHRRMVNGNRSAARRRTCSSWQYNL